MADGEGPVAPPPNQNQNQKPNQKPNQDPDQNPPPNQIPQNPPPLKILLYQMLLQHWKFHTGHN